MTDATAAAGAPPGRYTLGELEIERHPDGRVTLAGGSQLAGSSLTLDHAVARTSRDADLSLSEVLPMASRRPAAALGLEPAGRVWMEWDPESGSLAVTRVVDS